MALASMESFVEELKGDSTVVSIYAGEKTADSVPYLVPRTFLCRFEYFRRALSPNFREGISGVLHFPEDNIEAWTIFLFFLFQGRVAQFGGNEMVPGHFLLALTHAYVLGDKYSLGSFQNAVMRTLMNELKTGAMEPKWVVDILTLLPASSLVRKLMLGEVVYLVEHLNAFEWSDFREMAALEHGFEDMMKAPSEYYSRDMFPPHRWGMEENRLEEYMVSEKEEG